MSGKKFPIETERLILRPFDVRDQEAISAYYTLPEVQRYLDIPARNITDLSVALRTMRQQVSLQRPGDILTLAIERKADHFVIGQVSLRWYDATAGQAELRFVISPINRRQGFAEEASREIIDMAFDDFNIHRLFARCDARNTRAAKLMQRLGMRLEAHYREHALFQGEWDEELHFAILDREWRRSDKVRELTHRIA